MFFLTLFFYLWPFLSEKDNPMGHTSSMKLPHFLVSQCHKCHLAWLKCPILPLKYPPYTATWMAYIKFHDTDTIFPIWSNVSFSQYFLLCNMCHFFWSTLLLCNLPWGYCIETVSSKKKKLTSPFSKILHQL